MCIHSSFEGRCSGCFDLPKIIACMSSEGIVLSVIVACEFSDVSPPREAWTLNVALVPAAKRQFPQISLLL